MSSYHLATDVAPSVSDFLPLTRSTLHAYATLTRCLLAALHQEWVLGRSFAQNRGAQRSPSEGDRLSLSKNTWINASGAPVNARGKRKVPYSLI